MEIAIFNLKVRGGGGGKRYRWAWGGGGWKGGLCMPLMLIPQDYGTDNRSIVVRLAMNGSFDSGYITVCVPH